MFGWGLDNQGLTHSPLEDHKPTTINNYMVNTYRITWLARDSQVTFINPCRVTGSP